MSTNLIEILNFLEACYKNEVSKRKKGAPCTYRKSSMTLFFIVMMVKKIHAFQAMETYAQTHFAIFGFPQAPSRKTIRRWFLRQPALLQDLMPKVAEQCGKEHPQIFGQRWAFVDKSVFRALGGIWHKKHMILGIIPHKSIDSAASWAKSAYHGWRFGYGLHVICLQNRFPISACITTACVKDYHYLGTLLKGIDHRIGVLIGDAGYQCLKIIRQLWEKGIVLQTPNLLQSKIKKDSEWVQLYNDMKKTVQARLLYRRRKPSIEPFFSLIKQIFDLQDEKQLPYKGIERVNSFLMIATLAVQIMMYQNFINNRDLGDTKEFINSMK